jgi:hypothetical protein
VPRGWRICHQTNWPAKLSGWQSSISLNREWERRISQAQDRVSRYAFQDRLGTTRTTRAPQRRPGVCAHAPALQSGGYASRSCMAHSCSIWAIVIAPASLWMALRSPAASGKLRRNSMLLARGDRMSLPGRHSDRGRDGSARHRVRVPAARAPQFEHHAVLDGLAASTRIMRPRTPLPTRCK